jgi:hypothetical protein
VIEVTELKPADEDPDHDDAENLFLWQAETKPLPDALPPSDAEAQEIAVDPLGTGLLRLLFNSSDPNLTERVAGVCNSFYAMHGTDGLHDFRNALEGTGAVVDTFSLYSRPIPVRGELLYLNEDETPKRYALIQAYEKQKEVLDAFIERAVDRIETVAAAKAEARIQAVKQQLFREALRYLQLLAPNDGTSAASPLRGTEPLEGPEVEGLAQAMWEIAVLRRELSVFSGQYAKASKLAKKARQHYWQKQKEYEDAAAAAARERKRAENALATRCSENCSMYPVLYRLWGEPVVLEVGKVWEEAPVGKRISAVRFETTLRQVLCDTVNEVDEADTNFISELRGNPDEVWRYDPAVYAALDALHLTQGDLAWKAAEEKLESVNGSMTTLSKLSMGLGGVEMLAAVLALPPPAAAVIAVASLAAGAAELLESALLEARKDRAFSACLNPGDSLAVAPGSYGSVAVGALFLVLQVRDVGKGLGKLGGVR